MLNNDAVAKLKSFAALTKFSHDLFAAGNLADASMQAVNDSRILLKFRSSAIFECAGKEIELLAQSGVTNVNTHSQQAEMQKAWLKSLDLGKEPLILDKSCAPDQTDGSTKTFYCWIKLSPPPAAAKSGTDFVWLLEYDNEVTEQQINTAKLIGTSVAEALYFHKYAIGSHWNKKRNFKRIFFRAILPILLISAMFVKVPETTTAEFIVKAPEITAAYAWFDGSIARCLKQDGDFVRKNDIIVQYDTALLQYRLHMAQAALREVESELELEQQNSFTEQEKLGKVELLEARRDTLNISVKEAQWYLKHSEIHAPADGVLTLLGNRAELLAGKAVKTGEKLFEIYGGKGFIAEIPVNEENSSILQEIISVDMFLHTAPENAIRAVSYEVSSYPELTEQRTFCYMMRANLPEKQTADLRYGMRGVARISGKKVTLGYYLFKNLLLGFRSI